MPEPIRVLMINYKMQCAGIESFIMNIYRHIDRSKVQFDFLVHYTERQFYDDEIEQLGGRIYRLSIREDHDFIKYIRDLKQFFKNHPEYKIVHSHMESFGLFYLHAAMKAGVPVRIAHSHVAKRNRSMKGLLKGLLDCFFGTYATHCFACSDVAGKFIFGENTDYTVYKNAIDLERFKYNPEMRILARRELCLDEEEFVIGHVGRFSKEKNHSYLIDIFHRVHVRDSHTVLLLLGEGELETTIREKVDTLGLNECVKFLGVRRDMERIYQAMDLFVMPSFFEGLPFSGIEAQVAGLKCVFSDCITKQTSITDNTEYIPLSYTSDKWAEEILKWKNGYVRQDNLLQIRGAGYEITEQANRLMSFYLCHS